MTTMTEARRTYHDPLVTSLAPRRERLERTILGVLRAGGTRSELRDSVLELTDYLRTRGEPAQVALTLMREIGQRAAPFMAADGVAAVGDSFGDRMAMILRWTSTRYHRAD